jgi:FMN phosphatase YigB (HAD superfamily)/DNA-binding XRE family transcriptional regulator
MSDGGVSNLERQLGKRIQSFRRAAGLTQQQLCNQAGISYSTLTKIERGAIKSPSIFTVGAIASALNSSLDDLIGGERSSGTSRQLKKSNSGIRFVYFDVNGCLVRFYQRAFAKIAADYSVAPDLVEMAYLHFNEAVCKGTISMADFNREVADKIGVDSIDWASYYLDSADSVPGTAELLKWVQSNYRLGLLTNIMPGLLSSLRRLKKVPDLSYDVIVDSSETGHVKPEVAIFEIAAEKAGVQPSEILLVDDTNANVVAAEKAGWHVLWFDYAEPADSIKEIRETLQFD